MARETSRDKNTRSEDSTTVLRNQTERTLPPSSTLQVRGSTTGYHKYDDSQTETDGSPEFQVLPRPSPFGQSSGRVLTDSSMTSTETGGSTTSNTAWSTNDSGYGSMTSTGTIEPPLDIKRIDRQELGLDVLPQTQPTFGKSSEIEILPSIPDEDIVSSGSQLVRPEKDFLDPIERLNQIESSCISTLSDYPDPLISNDSEEVPACIQPEQSCMDDDTQKIRESMKETKNCLYIDSGADGTPSEYQDETVSNIDCVPSANRSPISNRVKQRTKYDISKTKRKFVRKAIFFFRIITCRGRHETDDVAEEQTWSSTDSTSDPLTSQTRDADPETFKKTAARNESQVEIVPAMEERDDVCFLCGYTPCQCGSKAAEEIQDEK